MKSELNSQTKNQLIKCVIDLSNRFGELGESETQSNLLVVAASIIDGTENMLGEWVSVYAEMRLATEKEKSLDFF